MGIIKEEISHPTINDVEITVDEHAKDEHREPYDIVNLDISFGSISTPDELVDLGRWLIEQGQRIKKQYTSTGKPRKNVSDTYCKHCNADPCKRKGVNPYPGDEE
ncbi:hypothetical protein GCM10027284_08910 [Cyclobacterium sediminis]